MRSCAACACQGLGGTGCLLLWMWSVSVQFGALCHPQRAHVHLLLGIRLGWQYPAWFPMQGRG
jgi:hypothetical protein